MTINFTIKSENVLDMLSELTNEEEVTLKPNPNGSDTYIVYANELDFDRGLELLKFQTKEL